MNPIKRTVIESQPGDPMRVERTELTEEAKRSLCVGMSDRDLVTLAEQIRNDITRSNQELVEYVRAKAGELRRARRRFARYERQATALRRAKMSRLQRFLDLTLGEVWRWLTRP